MAHELLKAGEPYTLKMLAINGGDLIRAGSSPGRNWGSYELRPRRRDRRQHPQRARSSFGPS